MMKNLILLFSCIFATSSALAYVAEFDKKSVYMAVKLGSVVTENGKPKTRVVAKVQVDPETKSLKTAAGQLNIVKYLGYIDEAVVKNYLETNDTYPMKDADLLKLHQKKAAFKKLLETSKRIPFASLIVQLDDPSYEVSVKIQNDSNPLRTLIFLVS